ncbi:MAG: tetratricopeptide repeat protein [Elusimicrobia bacterium]|nr:tetratricopeptide repeat protein [Elusimicrobiota bacterium]
MFSDLMFTGAYGTGTKDGRKRPFFAFAAKDLPEVRRLMAGMFVEIMVGRDVDGNLAYKLAIPDRKTDSWEIVPEPKDIPGLAQAAGDCDCVTMVKGSGADHIDLAPFAAGLRHDWSGRFSDALDAFHEGRVDEAQGMLETLSRERPDWPQARHWIGRCRRQRGDPEEAVACYREALGLCCPGERKALAPFAAAILSDMGVACKKKGDQGSAAVCLRWALTLRPNYPEALATSAALLADNEGIFMDALTRMLAIGGCEEIAGRLAVTYGQAMGKDVDAALGAAREAALTYDITRGLSLADPPLTLEHFFSDIGMD